MHLRRQHRRLLAWVCAFCVVFAQSAALAYACQRQALPELRGEAAPCAAHLTVKGSADAVPASGNVCEVHCHAVSLPDAGATIIPLTDAVLAWQLPPHALAVAPSAPVAELEAKSAAPPPRTLFARLLI